MPKTLQKWRRLHIWAGPVMALPVLLLSLSGIALNHTDQLELPSTPVPVWVAELIYGVEPVQQAQGKELETGWLVRIHDRLYLGGRKLITCPAPWKGWLTLPDYHLAACGNELILLDRDNGELLERLDDTWGLPDFSGLTQQQGQVYLISAAQIWQADLAKLVFKPVDNLPGPASSFQLETVPQEVLDWVQAYSVPPSLSQERLLLDLHSGRWLGTWGIWITDLVAVFLIGLAFTGWMSWSRRRKLRRK